MTNQYMIFGHKICVIFLFYNEYYMYSTFHYRNGRSCPNWNARVIMPFQANTQLGPPQVYWCVCYSSFKLSVCVFCFVVVFSSSCVLSPMLPVSLDCPFLIAPSVFSRIYLIKIQYASGYFQYAQRYFQSMQEYFQQWIVQ